jgi:hypothetical protein
MLPYKSPELCSRCGSLGPAAIWKVNRSSTQFNFRTYVTMWFNLLASRNEPDTFEVPVCSSCKVQLEQIKKITRVITISLAVFLGLFLGIIFLVKGTGGIGLFLGLLILIIVVLFGAILGLMGGIVFSLIIQEAMHYEFCTYDGQYYHFDNKKFRREFALLNPTLVKQKIR